MISLLLIDYIEKQISLMHKKHIRSTSDQICPTILNNKKSSLFSCTIDYANNKLIKCNIQANNKQHKERRGGTGANRVSTIST